MNSTTGLDMLGPEREWEDVSVLASGLLFPEGPIALADGSVLLVEMMRGTLSRVPAGGGTAEAVATCGGGPNGAALGPEGAAYLCNNGGVYEEVDGRLRKTRDTGGRIQRVDLETGAVTDLYTECDSRPLLAPNDLVFDSAGGFWFTDHGRLRERGRDHGGIYYATPDGRHIEEVVGDVPDPNGIALSPTGDVVYWAETVAKWVKRRPIEAPGRIKRIRRSDPWATVAALGGTVRFDSMAVDGAGRVCVGALEPGGICVIDPETGGWQMRTPPSELKENYVTNLAFGGPDMRDAYITCSLSGRLVRARWPAPGLTLSFQR